MNQIHIAYALNDKYAEMTCVSMCSVAANCKDSSIAFHLFAEQLSQEHTDRLSNLGVGIRNASVEFHDILIDSELFVTNEYGAPGLPNLTKEAYARVLMPELLPELDRLIYLDCDTVVESNIEQLWEFDLGDAIAGMAPDYSPDPKETKKQILGIEDGGIYFNSGVILMNLAGLREMQISRIVAENAARLYKQIMGAQLNWYADQEVLNYALQGKIKKLPMRYNSYFWIALPHGECIDECIEAYLNPAIVHFIATPKPSELGKVPVNLQEWERYYRYKAISTYASDGDAIKTSIYRKREANTLDALLPVFDSNIVRWYSYHFAKQLFDLALRRFNRYANGKNVIIWGLNERTWTLVVFLAAHGIEEKGVVDGLEGNYGAKVFDCAVQPPDVLRGTAGETFVMLDMRSNDIAYQLMETLQLWGYKENDYCHVYAPIWEGTEE